MGRSRLQGVGHYVPPLVETLGVLRPIEPDPPPGTSELGARAAARALDQAGLKSTDADFLIVATINPDVTFPGSGCYMQEKLGCGTIGALDVRAQCAGFIFCLSIADQFLRCGVYRRVLVVGAELHSVWVDYSPAGADVARLYGDGAGAVVLEASDGDAGVLSTVLHTDGRSHDRFWCEYPASRQHPTRITVENVRAGLHFPRLDMDLVRQFGREALPSVIREACERAGVRVSEVDRCIIGHICPDVAADVARTLGVSADRVVNPAAQYGHLSGAAIPVGLSTELAAGRLGPGSLVCLAAAGAGFAWGAALLRM